MKTVILIPRPSFHGNLAPLGFCYIASLLRESGLKVEIWDRNGEEFSWNEFEQRLKKGGISQIIIGTSYRFYGNCPPPTIREALIASRITKKVNRNIKTILVGPLSSIMPEAFLEEESIDFVIRGEPEYTLLELLTFLEKKKDDFETIQGISFRRDKVIHTPPRQYPDLNKLPFPARDLINMNNYIFRSYFASRVTSLLTSRGCPFSCNFCFGSAQAAIARANCGLFYRTVHPERVIEEIELLVRDYGVRGLRFEDPEFCMDKERVESICRLMIEKNLNFLNWKCPTRVSDIGYNLLNLMKKAGCSTIYYGVESGDQRILDGTNKKVTIEEIKRIFASTKRAGIQPAASFLFGLPGETRESINKSIAFAKEIDPFIATFHVFVPYPGTGLWKEPQKLKMETLDRLNVYFGLKSYSICKLSGKDLVRASRQAYRKFYFRFRWILKMLCSLRHLATFRYILFLPFSKKKGGIGRELLIKAMQAPE